MAHLKGILSYMGLSTNCNWQLRTRSTLFIPTDQGRSRSTSPANIKMLFVGTTWKSILRITRLGSILWACW